MLRNPVIETMLNRKSIRQYTDESPPDEVITTQYQFFLCVFLSIMV